MAKKCSAKNENGNKCGKVAKHSVRGFNFCEKHYKQSNRDWKRI